ESLQYFENLHQPLDDKFIEIVKTLKVQMADFFHHVVEQLHNEEGPDIDLLRSERNAIRELINRNFEQQLNLIKVRQTASKQALLQTGMFLQTRDIQAVLFRIGKLFGRFER